MAGACFPSSPANSMLLLKASGGMAHGGGKRIDADSPPYRILLRWIEQGTPFGRPSDPVVTRIEVLPAERLLERNAASNSPSSPIKATAQVSM